MVKKYSLISTATMATAVAIVSPFASVYAAGTTHNWTDKTSSITGQTSFYGSLRSAAFSASGKDIIVGGEDSGYNSNAFVSHDYGATWTNVTSHLPESVQRTGDFLDVAMSSNGQDIVMTDPISQHIVKSTDSGDLWTDITPDSSDYSGWDYISMSNDGSDIVLAGAYNASEYTITTNGGSSWQDETIATVDGSAFPDDIQFDAIHMSSDGNSIYVAGEDQNDATPYVLRSDDQGSTWKNITPSFIPTAGLSSIGVSDSGDTILLAVEGTGETNHYIAQSNDGGTTWSDVTPPETHHEDYWQQVELSGNGQVAFAYDNNGDVYISTDRGNTWSLDTSFPSSESWKDIALSNDGSWAMLLGYYYDSDAGSYPYNAYLSSNVVSKVDTTFKSSNGSDVKLTTPSGSVVTCHTAVQQSNLAAHDSQYQYPLGFVDFCFTTPDENSPIELTFVTNLKSSEVVVRKYNPNTKKYSNVPGATVVQTTLNGEKALKISYTLQDNGSQDLDPAIGQIKDPVGLGTKATTNVKAPDTGVQGQSNVGYGFAALGGIAAIATVVTTARRRLQHK